MFNFNGTNEIFFARQSMVQCISVAANIPFPQLFTVGVKWLLL